MDDEVNIIPLPANVKVGNISYIGPERLLPCGIGSDGQVYIWMPTSTQWVLMNMDALEELM